MFLHLRIWVYCSRRHWADSCWSAPHSEDLFGCHCWCSHPWLCLGWLFCTFLHPQCGSRRWSCQLILSCSGNFWLMIYWSENRSMNLSVNSCVMVVERRIFFLYHVMAALIGSFVLCSCYLYFRLTVFSWYCPVKESFYLLDLKYIKIISYSFVDPNI